MRVGIIGAGKMGLWLKREISALHEVYLHDVDERKSEKPLGELVSDSDVIIVAVGFRDVSKVLQGLSAMPLCGKLVMDIASFKKYVLDGYRALPDCALAATVHPMFGPGAESIKGKKVVVMEVPGRQGVEMAEDFFRGLGARVVRGSLDDHEKYVRYTIALSYAVGLALARIYSKYGDALEKYGGTSFRYLSIYVESLLGDPSAELYAEEARDVLDEFIEALKAKGMPRPTMDPAEAYELFYRALSTLGY